MSGRTDALRSALSARPGEWVSQSDLARQLYGADDVCPVTSLRLRQAVTCLRRELPRGMMLETGLKLGYRLIGAGAVE